MMENTNRQPNPTILVVDDTDRNRRLLQAMLTPLGHQVALARDGQEALAQVATHPPDVILLDVMMPGLSGYDVVRRLKDNAATRNIPVVMVTSLRDVEDRVQAFEAGADDFLSRPVDRTELRARVRSLLKLKAQHDHMQHYQQALEAEVARQTQALRSAYQKIRQASLDTIRRLAHAAEYRDEDTGAHILRMSHYAAAVARKMALNGSLVEDLLYAAPMHDVGKISVPDHILLKPGPLTPAEWKIMQAHTTVGGQILSGSDSDLLQLAEVIALTHHEKWDGSGYPRGLKGPEIPLVGRITAIADVFDAVTSNRPYREAYSVAQAFDILRSGCGSHFDPAVVAAFFAAQDEILSIKAAHEG